MTTHRAVRSVEFGCAGRVQLRIQFRRDGGGSDFARDIPQLAVVVAQQQHDAGTLAVEGAGGVLDDLGEELLDALVGDGGFVR